jgi:hypothetical protein
MRVTGVVIIRHQDHISAAKAVVIFGLPLICATRIACRDDVEFPQVLNILLAFNDNDDLFERDSLDKTLQIVENTPHIAERVNPPPVAIGAALKTRPKQCRCLGWFALW